MHSSVCWLTTKTTCVCAREKYGFWYVDSAHSRAPLLWTQVLLFDYSFISIFTTFYGQFFQTVMGFIRFLLQRETVYYFLHAAQNLCHPEGWCSGSAGSFCWERCVDLRSHTLLLFSSGAQTCRNECTAWC